MHINDFDYELPERLIARYPLHERSASRLLCLSRISGEITHRQFREVADLLQPGDLLVFNNTKVIPARLFAVKSTGGKCEILIERITDANHAWAHVRASKAPKPGTELYICSAQIDVGARRAVLEPTRSVDHHTTTPKITVIGRNEDLFHLESQIPLNEILNAYGHIPLPGYFAREEEALDKERYQTVYAQHEGAVAAPTAGLHFDQELLTTLQQRGIETAFVTLHVGAGTFQPVRVENILEHRMHYEYVEVSNETCEKIKAAKARGSKVIAVGTTSARSLETAAQKGELYPFIGDTNLFIYPGFQFHVIDGLITNFHLPKSTLLMLVSAFAGREHVLAAYQSAIDHEYRFYSYGDAMFLV